jgi:hypothetical protein
MARTWRRSSGFGGIMGNGWAMDGRWWFREERLRCSVGERQENVQWDAWG